MHPQNSELGSLHGTETAFLSESSMKTETPAFLPLHPHHSAQQLVLGKLSKNSLNKKINADQG